MLNMAMRFAGATTNPYDSVKDNTAIPKWIREILAPILNVLNSLLLPLIIILGAAGGVYAIVLGVQYSKAESADKRKEVQGRLIGACIGAVIIVAGATLCFALDWNGIYQNFAK